MRNLELATILLSRSAKKKALGVSKEVEGLLHFNEKIDLDLMHSMKITLIKETVITKSNVDFSKILTSLNSRIYFNPNGNDRSERKYRRRKGG